MTAFARCVPWLLALAAAAACGHSDCGDACTNAGGWQVRFPDMLEQAPRAVVYSGLRSGVCRRNLVCTAAGTVSLGDSRWGECPDDELVAFAPERAPFRAAGEPDIPAQAGLRGPIAIPVQFWIVAPGGPEAFEQLRTFVSGQIADAKEAYRRLGVGVTLDVLGVDSVHDASISGTGCSSVPTLRAPTTQTGSGLPPNAPLYDADRLNVFYVNEVENYSIAIDCKGDQGDQAAEIIFVSFSPDRGATAATLAHEIGHAVGSKDWGHTDYVEGIGLAARGNFMYSSVQEITEVTLGQIYRVHFDAGAWLESGPRKRALPWAQSASNAAAVACQSSHYTNDPCPSLALRPDRKWP